MFSATERLLFPEIKVAGCDWYRQSIGFAILHRKKGAAGFGHGPGRRGMAVCATMALARCREVGAVRARMLGHAISYHVALSNTVSDINGIEVRASLG